MSKKFKAIMFAIIVAIIVIFAGVQVMNVHHDHSDGQRTTAVHHSTVVTSAMRKQPSEVKSSETKSYPQHLSAKRDRIVVSLKNQRAYLMRGNKLRYEFYVSTGKNVAGRRTPTGHYRINQSRTKWFYSPSEHEGARYAVGWHDGGVYLFHETPSHKNGKIIKSVAKDLGKKGSSYGCVHLSVNDAKWFYHHVPTGMPVIIK